MEINNPKNIIGMSDILVDKGIEIDIDELEKSIYNNDYSNKKIEKVEYDKSFNKELESLTNQFNLNKTSKDSILSSFNNSGFNGGSFNGFEKPTSDKPTFDGNSFNSGSFNSNFEKQVSNISKNSPFLKDSDSDSDSDNDSEPKILNFKDDQLNIMTDEEIKQKQISKVLGKVKTDESDVLIKQEEDEQEVAEILEQIYLLKSNLEAEGIDIKRIPEVNYNSSKKEIKAVLRILQIKNDRLRYCDMFEEGILACSYFLENIFDGKKEFFGTRIDLVGWPETVKVKLKRMRYDTSTFVGEIMKGYNLNSGWRILFELLPSIFLYSRDRKLKTNDNLISDDKYLDAINQLNN